MISKYTYKGITWIDLERPTKEEAETLIHEYAIPDSVSNELLTETVRSKVDLYDETIYLILHFPRSHTLQGVHKFDQEVDIVLGKNFVITVHYEPVAALLRFARNFEREAAVSNEPKKIHTGILFYQIIKELYKDVEEDLENMNELFTHIENHIFHDQEALMVRKISNTNRLLIDYKQALRFHREILESFEKATHEVFGNAFSYYTTAIVSEYNKIDRILTGHKEILNDLRDTNDSLLSVKTGHVMKTLTMMSFIVFPLSLIAGMFGMNAQHMPIIGNLHDFWIIVALMAGATISFFLFFKLKKWI